MHTLPASRSMFVLVSALLTAAVSGSLHSEPIPVRHPQGSAHGFLILKTTEGTSIATGDVTQMILATELHLASSSTSVMDHGMTKPRSSPNGAHFA
jgi:hypothetical protein